MGDEVDAGNKQVLSITYLQLGLGEGRVGGAKTKNVDERGSGKGLDALVLVVEEIMACELLGDLGQRLGVKGLLVEIRQLVAQCLEAPDQLLGRDGLSWPP